MGDVARPGTLSNARGNDLRVNGSIKKAFICFQFCLPLIPATRQLIRSVDAVGGIRRQADQS